MWSIVSYPTNVWINEEFKINITGATPAPGKRYSLQDLTYPSGGTFEEGYFNNTSGDITSSNYTILWRVRFPEGVTGPRQFEIKGDGLDGTSQIITIDVNPLPIVSFPSQVLFNTEFTIEVSGAIPGQSYSIFDWTADILTPVATGIAPSSSFTIYIPGLTRFTGPHEIRARFNPDNPDLIVIGPVSVGYNPNIVFYINAYTDTWNATVWPGQDGRFFESQKRYQTDIARAGPAITFDQPLPRTITLGLYNLDFPEGYGLFPGWRVYVRNIYNISKFFSGTVISWNRALSTLVLNVDHSENVEGYTVTDWTVDQDAYIEGEKVEEVYPILIQDPLGPVTRSDLTYTQVDLGQGLLPSYLSINPATGSIEGTIPADKMSGYTIGIEITDGFRTQVVAWRFGGIVGPLSWGPSSLNEGGDRLRYPIYSALPNGIAQVVNRGLVSPNIFDYVWADGKDFLDANGDGFIDVALPTPNQGRYRPSLRLKIADEVGIYEKYYNVGTDTFGNARNSDLIWQGVYVRDFTSFKMSPSSPVVISAATTTLTLRLGQPIAPTSIISASGGVTPLRYVLGPIGNGFYPNGYLNDGLSFNTSTGVISGTPTSLYGKTSAPGLGGDTFWINVTDGIKDADENGAIFFTLNGLVSNFTATTVLTTSTVIIGVPVSLIPVIASNALGSVTFAISPSVPTGLSFNTNNGQITGTASTTSTLTLYSVTVNDAGGSVSTATFSLRVESSNLFTSLVIPTVNVSAGSGITPFVPVTYTGGYGTIAYSVSPNLPSNLILNTTNGQISGVPVATQSATPYTIRVRDEANQISTQTFSLTISPPFSADVVNPELAFARGVEIDPVRPVEGNNGVLPYSYSISPSLPSGLLFNTVNGFITGTPTVSSTLTNRIVTITDANSKIVTGSFSLRVQPLVVNANTLTIVRAADYNDIKTLTEEILGTNVLGYGYQGVKSVNTTSVGNIIGWEEWSNLKDDINLCTQHHFGAQFSYTTSSVVTEVFVNQLINNLNTIESIRYNKPYQVATGTTSSVWTSTYVSSWGSYIDSTATFTWAEGLDINYFFNLGGSIEFEIDYQPSGSTANNLGWQTLIDESQTVINNFIYDRESYLNFTTVSTSTTSTTGSVVLSVIKDQNTLTCSIQLTNNLAGTTDLQVQGGFKYVYSDTVLSAPLPREIDVKEFTTGTFTPVFTPVKSLRLTAPTNLYTWNVGASSNVETITIQNTGNQPVNVNSITFNDNANVDRIVNGNVNGSIGSFTVNTTSNYTFTLAYTGTNEGSFSSQFTVNAESAVGPITTSTRQVIGAQPFSISVSPSSISSSLSGLISWRQDFVINSLNGDSFTYSASLLSADAPPGSIGWSISNDLSTGPTVTFSPSGSTLPVYTATVSVFIVAVSASGSDSATVPITLDLNIPISSNLGTWVSPLAANNAVIGMSYDVMAGERYLTIGVGMGADGSVPLNVGGISSVDVANLGITADPDFQQGQRLFPVGVADQASDWSPFLKALGSWPNSIPEQPYNINVANTPTYRFYAPTTGDYEYEFSIDDDGEFYLFPSNEYGLNTGPRISLSPPLMNGGASSNWRQSYTGTVNLTAGWYILRYYHINYARKTAAACQIKDPSGNVIWNTRYPVRNYLNYLYWQDVIRIRIPADGTPRDLFSSLWYVKNTYQVSNKAYWGYYFNPDMFKVSDDGNGNLTIVIFGTPRAPLATDPNASNDTLTIKMLNAAFYYYLPTTTTSARYSNLDVGPVGDGNQTRYFSGFDSSGNVLTVLQTIPTTLSDPVPTNPGGGGGGGGGTIDDQFNYDEK